ncbi:MAG: hypothetical protein AAF443_08515 [Chlamydiota bacterium]
MIKKLCFTTLAFLGCAFMCQAVEPAPKTPEQQTSHLQADELKLLDQILADYANGKYSAFLNRSHEKYLESNTKKEHDDLRKESSKLSPLVQDYSKVNPDPFHKKIQCLRENHNRELIEVCIHHPNAKLSREVKDMIFSTPTQKERDSLDYLTMIGSKSKGEGQAAIENQLIAIDCEFWSKQIALEVALSEKKISQETFQKQTLVLQLEKLRQMKAAVQQEGVDPKVKQHIEIAAQVCPKAQAFALTRKHLIDLGEGKIEPKTPEEKQFHRIVKKHISQEQALASEYFPSSESPKAVK